MRYSLLAALLIFLSPGAFACKCNPERLDRAKRQPLDYALLAFVADVQSVEETTQGALATFEVVKYWKGVSEKILVMNVMVHSNCGLTLAKDARYLVISVVEPTFGMNICNTEITPIKDAKKIMARLGKGKRFKH